MDFFNHSDATLFALCIPCRDTGKSFKVRALAHPSGSACPRKCTALISEEERRSVFQQYWKIGNKKDNLFAKKKDIYSKNILWQRYEETGR